MLIRFLLVFLIGFVFDQWLKAWSNPPCSPSVMLRAFEHAQTTQYVPNRTGPRDTIVDVPDSRTGPRGTIVDAHDGTASLPQSKSPQQTGDYGSDWNHAPPRQQTGDYSLEGLPEGGVPSAHPVQRPHVPVTVTVTENLAVQKTQPLEKVFSVSSPELQSYRGQPMVARLGPHEWTGTLDFREGHPVLIRSEPGALPQVIPPRAEILGVPATTRANNVNTGTSGALVDQLEKRLSEANSSGHEFPDLFYFRRSDGSIGSGYFRMIERRDGQIYFVLGATPNRALNPAFVERVPSASIVRDSEVIQNYRSGRSGGPRPRP